MLFTISIICFPPDAHDVNSAQTYGLRHYYEEEEEL